MKKSIFTLFIAGSLMAVSYSCSSNSPVPGEEVAEQEVGMSAIEYNDFIVDHQSKIITKMMSWMSFQGDDVVGELEDIVELTQTALKEIKDQKPCAGGEELRTAALDLFSYYERTLSGAFMEVATTFQEAGGELDPVKAIEITQKIQEATADEAKYDAAFQRAQQNFARANNMDIRENELQDQIDALSN